MSSLLNRAHLVGQVAAAIALLAAATPDPLTNRRSTIVAAGNGGTG